jgi:redox-sensitive bicupin YhaK (pirin superfamily)
MITLRRSEERHHLQSEKLEAWLGFNQPDRADPFGDGLASGEIIDEYWLSPGASIQQHPPYAAEIITYVCDGALTSKATEGRSEVVYAGGFQRASVGLDARLRQTNASHRVKAHVFQIWLEPPQGKRELSQQQKRFSVAERRGVLCVVASPDARRGSLRIHQDVLVYSALLEPGQHLVHPFVEGHSGWLNLVEGVVELDDAILASGDGVGINAERSVSFTACEKTEILLLDFGS